MEMSHISLNNTQDKYFTSKYYSLFRHCGLTINNELWQPTTVRRSIVSYWECQPCFITVTNMFLKVLKELLHP